MLEDVLYIKFVNNSNSENSNFLYSKNYYIIFYSKNVLLGKRG